MDIINLNTWIGREQATYVVVQKDSSRRHHDGAVGLCTINRDVRDTDDM